MLGATKCALFVGLLGLLASSCGQAPSSPRTSISSEATAFAVLADAIDPGKIQDVTSTFDAELSRTAVEDTAGALARATRSIDALLVPAKDELMDYPPALASELLAALAELERLAGADASVRGRACALLHEGYGLLSFVIMPQTLGEQLARLNGKSPQLSAPTRRRVDLMQHMPDLKRRAAACVLRANEPRAAIASALETAGRYVAERGDALRANALHEQAMERRADEATAVDWMRLASSRAAALLPERARLAFERAKAKEKDLPSADRLSYQREARRTEGRIAEAERAARLAGKTGQEDEVSYALALRELRPPAAVRPSLEALARKYPRDARPLVALSRLRLADDGLDPEVVRDAEALLRRGSAGDHRPAEYYDLMLAFGANELTRVIATVTTPKQAAERMKEGFARLLGSVPELDELSPPRAAPLRLVADMFQAMLEGNDVEAAVIALLRSRLDVFEALADRHPTSSDVARAAMLTGYSAGAFDAPDPARAFRLVNRDLEAAARDEPALIVDQLRLLSGLAMRHTSYLPEVERAIAKASTTLGDRPRPRATLDLIEADHLAARWRIEKQPELATRAVAVYARALDALPGEDRARALHNLVVLQRALGQRARTHEDLATVLASKKTSEHVALNQAILLALDKRPEAEKALAALAEEPSTRAETRASAHAWLARLAKERGDRAAARTAANEASKLTKGHVPLERGLLFEGSLTANVVYAPSSPRLYRIQLALRSQLWLVLEPALPETELQALAAAAPRAAAPPKK